MDGNVFDYNRKKAALKEKRRQINERLVQQSSVRKAKTIEKAHLLPTELLEAAKDLDWYDCKSLTSKE